MKKIIMLFFSFFFFIFAFTFVISSMVKGSSSSEITEGGDDFIYTIVEYHYEAREKYDVLTSVSVAQAIEESGWGTSTLSKEAKNLFGMKGDFKGESYVTPKGDKYRKYPSYKESVVDHARLLCNDNYQCAGVKDYQKVLDNLKKGRYSENKDYINKIKKLIEDYNLTQYDNLTKEDLEKIKKNSYIDYMPNGASETGNAIVKTALSKLGKPYKWGANGPDMFDCSGFVWWCCKENGITFQRTTAAQLSKMGKSVSHSQLQPGDIITFKTEPPRVSHVGIYIGNNKFVHAPHTGDVVKVTKLNTTYWQSVVYNYRRLY